MVLFPVSGRHWHTHMCHMGTNPGNVVSTLRIGLIDSDKMHYLEVEGKRRGGKLCRIDQCNRNTALILAAGRHLTPLAS